MHRNYPAPENDHPGQRPAPAVGAGTGPAPRRAEPIRRRQLEKSVSLTGRERLRYLWYRLRLTIAEMNYATRRMVELQAPWIADPRWASADARGEARHQ
jgi:hypothetical protein